MAKSVKLRSEPRSSVPLLLAPEVVWRNPAELRPFPQNSRAHPQAQITALKRSIRELGWSRPIAVDETGTILFGHGCVEAAKQLRLGSVPTLTLSGLTAEKKRALVIADNKLAEKSSWDMNVLKVELADLVNLDLDVELTGFSTGEIDLILGDAETASRPTERDVDETLEIVGPAISRIGDVWTLGDHRVICGDARAAETYQLLLGDDQAQMVVTDPPYNVKVQGHARGRGQTRQREFAMASGEMSSPGFTGFLETVMSRAIQFSQRASIHYWFIDWRHLREMLRASAPLYSEWKNLLVWRKSNAGQGSFYRSQHELIAVFKAGSGSHINNFGLGAEGRRRTNVLDYPGGSTLSATRQQELDMHPTVKPIPLIADLILDCSKRNGIVLDLFGGSGTTILAAEQTGRRARVIEIDPLYVDLAVRRWQSKTGKSATHATSGRSFDKTIRARHGK